MKRILLCNLFFLLACAGMRAQVAAPVISEILTPYALLKSSVEVGAIKYGPGSVAYGPVGAPIAIRGANFGSGGTVAFVDTKNTMRATVPYTTADGTTIYLSVPGGAKTGAVVVTSSGQNSIAFPIVIVNGSYSASCSPTPSGPPLPIIAKLTPDNGPAGALVTIAGQAFGALPGSVVVNGSTATVMSWKTNSILVWVPDSVPTGTLVPVIVIAGGQSSNATGFSVLGPPSPDPTCVLAQ